MQAPVTAVQKNLFLLSVQDSLYAKSVEVFFAHKSSTVPSHNLSPVRGGSEMLNPIPLYSQLELKPPEYCKASNYLL